MRLAVFGLGNFGSQVAVQLGRTGHDVLAVDRREDRVQAVRDSVSRAVVAEAADRQTLKELGVGNSDAAVVSLGTDMAHSIMMTFFLKEMGVPRVIVKALHDDHSAVLKMVGADEVIFPEREMAIRLAHTLVSPNILEYLPLSAKWAIAEVEVLDEMVGRSLIEVNFRKKWKLSVLAFKRGGEVEAVVSPDDELRANDVLIVMGHVEDLDRYRAQVR